MTAYRSLILHHVRIGNAPAATIFALRMAARIRSKHKERHQEQLASRADEGEDTLATDVAVP
jgi:hypothetical protein